MSLVKDMRKGFEFAVCGHFDEPVRFVDDETKEVTRMIRVLGFGKKYSLFVDTEEELSECPPPDTEVRIFGRIDRQGGTSYVKPRVKGMIYKGMPNWKPFTDEDVLAGCKFGGWGMVVQKKITEYAGVRYRNLQMATMGETFLFRDYGNEEIYDLIPDTGPGYAVGHLETFVGSSSRGKELFMTPVVDSFRKRTPKDDAMEQSPEPERKPA